MRCANTDEGSPGALKLGGRMFMGILRRLERLRSSPEES